jgi:hypothetical protein
MRGMWSIVAMLAVTLALSGSVLATAPQYTIIDIGVLTGDTYSQGYRISRNGIATGRSMGSTYHAFSWTQAGGLVSLPNLTSPVRNYSVGNGVNDTGIVVGNGTTTSYGSSPLPLIWQNGTVSQLPLPLGQTLGRAQDINDSNVAVGSVNSGVSQRASIYSGGTGTVITRTTSIGCYGNVAYGINNSGLVIGTGIDPNNAARNVGFVYDMITDAAYEVGALPGKNGALCFDVSDAGHVVGGSMLNQGDSMPFVWTATGGITAIPLPVGTSMASARGVNSAGWVVGNASSAYAIPFLYDGSLTYRLADLLPAGTGWDLSTNTSSSALGISESGIIVGSGVYNGMVHAYAMIPVPEPATVALLALAGSALLRRRR